MTKRPSEIGETMQPQFRPAENKSEIEQALELLYAAFPKTPPAYFQKHQWDDPTLATGDTYLALDGDRVAAVVQLFPRQMVVRGQTVPLAGIGNVGTHPDYRGEGLASRLMDFVLRDARRRGFQLAMLFTRIDTFFSRFGFIAVDRNEFTFEPVPEPPRGEVQLFRPESDLEAVMALYADFSSKRTGNLHRDETYWQGQLRFADDDSARFTLLWRQGRLVAYARALPGDATLRLAEFAYRDSVYDMFALASAVARQVGASRIQLPLTQDELLQAPLITPVDEGVLDKIMLLPLASEELVSRFKLWDDEPQAIIDTLFRPGEFTYWQTDFF